MMITTKTCFCNLWPMAVAAFLIAIPGTSLSQVGGSGRAGAIPVWTGTSTLGVSSISQNSTGKLSANAGAEFSSVQLSGTGIVAAGGAFAPPGIGTGGLGVSAFGGNAGGANTIGGD